METWTTFGSESDLKNRPPASASSRVTCSSSMPVAVTGRDQMGVKSRNDPAKRSTDVVSMFDPLLSDTTDGAAACCSLPSGALSCIAKQRQSLTAAGKCSSSCENLDSCSNVGESNIPGHAKLCKASSDNPVYGNGAGMRAPPVPPRDYVQNDCAGGKSRGGMVPRRAEIHPVVQDGKQVTRTHYWLLPDKLRKSVDDSVIEMTPELYINVTPPTPQVSASGLSGDSVSSRVGAGRKGILPSSDSDAVCLLADEADIDTASVDLPYGEILPVKSAPKSFESHAKAAAGKTMNSDIIDGGDSMTTSMGDVQDMIEMVQKLVQGVTGDESYTALSIHNWKVDAAVKYLKVEHLFRLGVATRSKCQSLLDKHNWNVECAASALLDQPCAQQKSVKSTKESQSSRQASSVGDKQRAKESVTNENCPQQHQAGSVRSKDVPLAAKQQQQHQSPSLLHKKPCSEPLQKQSVVNLEHTGTKKS